MSTHVTTILYLIAAGLSLILALRLMRQALAPIGALVQAVGAATLAVVAISTALVLVVAAALSAG